MKKQPWIFTGNTFNRATRGSHVKMLNIATDTDTKLAGKESDPNIGPIYTDYHPVFTAYRDICNAYNYATGTREGETLNVVTLLKVNMKQNLPLYEGKVRSVYPEGSPQEKAYFPNGREPFMEGTYTSRIEAVHTLADRLAADPSPVLTAYAPVVESFYNMLLAGRSTQVQEKGLITELTVSRENQRLAVAKALYTVLARLMSVFHNDSSMIKGYFDLALIRSKDSSIPETELVAKGKVTVAGTTTPVVNARVVLTSVDDPLKPGVEAFTNSKGRYIITLTGLTPGEHGMGRITVDVDGYNTFQWTFEGHAGKSSTINAQLQPAIMLKKVA